MAIGTFSVENSRFRYIISTDSIHAIGLTLRYMD